MSQSLQPGGNITIGSYSGTVVVTHDSDSSLSVNLTAFLLTDAGKVLGDSGIVYYNQPTGPGGAATFSAPLESGGVKTHRIDFDLKKSPAGITKLAVTLTEDNRCSFAAVKNLKAEVRSGNDVVHLPPGVFTVENGIIVLELYVRNEQPKVRAVWQGYASGLDGLCSHFGVDVEDDSAQSSHPPAPGPYSSTSPPPPLEPGKINLQKVSGKVQLSKGSKPVLIKKTPEITASVSWSSGTDYDVYALVYTQDNRQIDVATFGAHLGNTKTPPLMNFDNGAVKHMGDVGAGGCSIKTEIIKIRLNDKIIAVVPVAYSAQSNGTGSFYRYKVSMTIDNNDGTTVTILADNANNNDNVYSCVPGMILNTPDGVVIQHLELYSKPGSENRPKLKLKDGQIEVVMDAGPLNDYK
ncbi:MAG: TerD family protein [Desulfuromonadaceae bacterium]